MIKQIYLPTLYELAVQCDEPRVHPNGFIQLDLNDTHRLHVWHPSLPYRQKTYHPIHDHVFGFTSKIFSGRITNVQYDVVADSLNGTHYMAQARSTGPEETILIGAPQPSYYDLRPHDGATFQAGEQYEFPAFQFHEILFNEPSLTIIRKHTITMYEGNPRSPTVMVPRGVCPDNDFCRKDVDTDFLWELIVEAYPS